MSLGWLTGAEILAGKEQSLKQAALDCISERDSLVAPLSWEQFLLLFILNMVVVLKTKMGPKDVTPDMT